MSKVVTILRKKLLSLLIPYLLFYSLYYLKLSSESLVISLSFKLIVFFDVSPLLSLSLHFLFCLLDIFANVSYAFVHVVFLCNVLLWMYQRVHYIYHLPYSSGKEVSISNIIMRHSHCLLQLL